MSDEYTGPRRMVLVTLATLDHLIDLHDRNESESKNPAYYGRLGAVGDVREEIARLRPIVAKAARHP